MTQKGAKNAEEFKCSLCDFICSKKSNYDKHLLTRKHKNNDAELLLDDAKKCLKYKCDCGKEYTYRQGLYIHKKKCQYLSSINNIIVEQSLPINDISLLTNIVLDVVKNNSDLQKQSSDLHKQFMDYQKQMFEMCKTMQTNITMNNSNNNNSNNTFNMQVFLNEECKDAMNISDFVNSVNIQLEDLENVGKLGYATGMSNIIVKELKMLDVYKRPIHCSDIKRETFYVKDNDVWEKETPENNKMKKAIKGISQKNMVKLNDWRDKHPDCLDSSSSYNDIYLNLMVESCGGRGDFSVGENKILKNIAKEVVIKK